MNSTYKNFLVIILTVGFGMLFSEVRSQQNQKVPLKEAIASYAKSMQVKFFYKEEWIKDILVDSESLKAPLPDFLTTVMRENGLGFLLFHDAKYVIFFKGNPPVSGLRSQTVNDTTRLNGDANDKKDSYTVHGTIRDAVTGEAIVGATVYAEQAAKGTTTDVNGNFSIMLPSGINTIRINAAGRLATIQGINLNENQRLDLEMYEQSTQLEDIVVTSQRADRNISSTEMSQLRIDIKTLKTIPQFMGEVDVVKSLLLLPGVSTVGEGASGFNVRGGNVDQNLVLLDDVPLFNTSHLFGFFSTFNPDLVKDVTLMKGGIPANYGGRVSSVLDVKMKDGNSNKLSVYGGIGIISSRLAIEGPISKKTTFIVGGRYAYPDWIIQRVPDLNVQRSSSNFYDLNLRLRHQFNDRNSIYLSGYRSADKFKFAADTTYGWSTTNVSARWNASLNKYLYLNLTGLYSKFENSITGTNKTKEFEAAFGIETKGAKLDFSYLFENQNRIDFGASLNDYTFNNGKLIPGPNSSVNPINLQQEYSREMGIYANGEIKLSEVFSVNAGLRYSLYSTYGPADVAIYDPTVPKKPSTVTETKHYDSGQIIKQYDGWEPRLSMKVSVDSKSSVKLSYNRNLQYIQLISNTTAVSPLDLWRSSNYYIKPQIGNQVAIGYFRNLMQDKLEISAEGYYKEIENLMEYKDGASLFMNQYLESQLLAAKGVAYGVELMIKKKEGPLTGWFAYTFSRSLRQVQGLTPEETVNSGKQYPSNYDKPHNITVVANYAFTRRLSLSANFTYSTGRPVTYPTSVYLIDGYAVAQFSDRNQARIPDYHRLDLSFTIEESLKRTKKWKGSWTFSIYNVYGRANPYSVFFKPQYNGFQTQSYKLSVIGTVFPSITYNFKF